MKSEHALQDSIGNRGAIGAEACRVAEGWLHERETYKGKKVRDGTR